MLVPLILCRGDFTATANSQGKENNSKTMEEILKVPDSVKSFARSLSDSPLGDKPVLVRLSRNVGVYIVTSKNGYHLNVFANKLGIRPIAEGGYSNYVIGFYSTDDRILKRAAQKFDRNRDKVISLEELSGF